MANNEEKEMGRPKPKDFHPEIFKSFDLYTHGLIDRRGFLESASKFAVGGMTAEAILAAFTPNAMAHQIAPDDKRIRAEYVNFPSPKGHTKTGGYLARSANAVGRLPGVIVIHGAAGLESHFEDVARVVALSNFVAFAPDAISPLGGHAVSQSEPGNREKGQQMMNQLDPTKRIEDFVAAVEFLKTHPATTGKVGVVGFCWGGGMTNTLAVRVTDLAAAVPFYGAQPAAADVPKIKAPLLIHYAGLDERLNKGWPAYEAALKAAGKSYTVHFYEGAQHAFHNDDDGPRYNKAVAELAWQRTLDFLNKHLRQS
jgi:carboxymethylenebutenolidase